MTTITEPRMTPTARRLLETAERLFYEHGLHAVGVERIAEEAATTKKTLYDRFGSKDGLITAYLRARAERWRAFAGARIEEHPDPGPDRVLALFAALTDWMSTHTRGCSFVNAYAELAGTSHTGLVVIAEDKAWTRAVYTSLLDEMGVPDAARRARELALVHEGAIVEMTAGSQPQAFEDGAALMARLVDDGVAARDAGSRPVG